MKQVEKGLISGKEALIALANGEEVENWNGSVWWSVEGTWQLDVFLKTDRKFRIKPKTILLNGIEIPAPFEPKDGQYFYYLSSVVDKGYNIMNWNTDHYECYCQYGAWKSEDEIKQVVAALRKVFKGE